MVTIVRASAIMLKDVPRLIAPYIAKTVPVMTKAREAARSGPGKAYKGKKAIATGRKLAPIATTRGQIPGAPATRDDRVRVNKKMSPKNMMYTTPERRINVLTNAHWFRFCEASIPRNWK